jgi:bifunctional UDP-N-acetylglucosamine pyrophosphorylase/glucosamine-1-phosphate N-acetyltransferase
MSAQTQAILLAAGKSTRFNTTKTKLSHTICGQEVIRFPLNLLRSLGINTTVVVGYQQEVVRDIITKNNYQVSCVEQKIQKGTGHALLCTKDYWHAQTLLIFNGDAPLITQQQVKNLIDHHRAMQATVSFIAAYNADPSVKGYGRVITKDGTISIVEQRDFTGDPSKECRLNAGVYLIERAFLEEELPSLASHPSGEIFITDLIKRASETQKRVEVIDIPFDCVRGINTLKELWVAERLMRSELIQQLMDNGVRFSSPESVEIDMDVTIGPDSVIGFGVQLKNGTAIGNGVIIGSFSVLDQATISDNATIHSHSVIHSSTVHKMAIVGPYAHIHRNSTLHQESVVGNFVEVSKSVVGPQSKAKHLSYLGQASIGSNVNIGAGTITCNYDGVNKHETTIQDNAFIGSNSTLLAPLTIGEGALIAAGSTINQDVPNDALAIARQQQVTKEQYVPKLKKKLSTDGPSNKLSTFATLTPKLKQVHST